VASAGSVIVLRSFGGGRGAGRGGGREQRQLDRAAIEEICVLTGDAGADARSAGIDTAALIARYATPYLDLEPDFAVVAEFGESAASGDPDDARPASVRRRVVGYAIGAPDSRTFAHRFAELARETAAATATASADTAPGRPTPRATRPPPTAPGGHPGALTPTQRRAHAESLLVPELDEFPSHLHVDLLPPAQGRGVGRRLVDELLARFAAAGSPGVHLGVDPSNTGAQAFYARVGFRELRRDDHVVLFGRTLT
jgi:GNAT superfamily N-acetyltransferase